MKYYLLLVCLSFLTLLNCQEKNVFFFLYDASNSTTEGIDGESQFFDYAVKEKQISFVVSPNSTYDLFTKIKPYFADYGINPNLTNDAKIQSAKSYWRSAGHLPYDLVTEEMDLANNDHFHTPDLNHTQLSIFYLVGKRPMENPYQIKHHINEVCAKFGPSDFRHFILDRAYNAIYPNIWSTKIRLIYTGKSKNCALNDSAWADKRAGKWNNSGVITPQLHVVAQGQVSGHTLEELVDDIKYYFFNFPIYNTLINCQHFGSNLFNKWTSQNHTFISDDVMLRVVNGTSNLAELIVRFPKINQDDGKSNDDHDKDDHHGSHHEDKDKDDKQDDKNKKKHEEKDKKDKKEKKEQKNKKDEKGKKK